MIISRLFIIGFLLSASEVSTHFAPNWSLEATTTLVLLFPPANLLAPVRNLEECKNLVHACASAKVSANLSQVENLRRYVATSSCADYTATNQYLSSVFSAQAQTSKTSQLSQISKSFIIVYQIKKGTEMTEHEFYAQIQEDYFKEFAGAELSEIFVDTNIHPEFFEFDDIPF